MIFLLLKKGEGSQVLASSQTGTVGERSIRRDMPPPALKHFIKARASTRNLQESGTAPAEGQSAHPDSSPPTVAKTIKKSLSTLSLRPPAEPPLQLETSDIEKVEKEFYGQVPKDLKAVYQTINGTNGFLKRMSKGGDGDSGEIDYRQMIKNAAKNGFSVSTVLTNAAVNAAYKEAYLMNPPSFDEQEYYLNTLTRIEKDGNKNGESTEEIQRKKTDFIDKASETYMKTLVQFQTDVDAFNEAMKKPDMTPIREANAGFLYTLQKELFPRMGIDEDRPADLEDQAEHSPRKGIDGDRPANLEDLLGAG